MNYTDSLVNAYQTQINDSMSKIEKNDAKLSFLKEVLYTLEDSEKAERLRFCTTFFGAMLGLTLGSLVILTGVAGPSLNAALLIWAALATLSGIFAYRKNDSIVDIADLIVDYEVNKLEDRNTVLYDVVAELEESVDRIVESSYRCRVINPNEHLVTISSVRAGA